MPCSQINKRALKYIFMLKTCFNLSKLKHVSGIFRIEGNGLYLNYPPGWTFVIGSPDTDNDNIKTFKRLEEQICF